MSPRLELLGRCFFVGFCYMRRPLIIFLFNSFKGAYCTVLENEPLHNLFGDMDVVDDTLPGMAEKIIAAQAAS
jgi:arginine decarboxylase-like protein